MVDLPLEILTGVEIPCSRIRDRAADANDVEIGARPRLRLGVVVIEVERVCLRLLQEIDDLPVLMRTLVEAIPFQLHGRRSEGRWPRPHRDGGLRRGIVPETDAEATVRLLEDLTRKARGDEFVPSRQNHRIAIDAEGSREDDRVAAGEIARRVFEIGRAAWR